MKNGIQLYEFLRVGEDDCAEFFAVDVLSGRRISLRILLRPVRMQIDRAREFVADLIGVKNAKVHFTQAGATKLLPLAIPPLA